MESDLPLIAVAEEDDSLIQQFPDLDQTPSKSSISDFTFSPFALPPSHAKSVKDGVHMEKPISSSSEAINNKENVNSNSVEVPKLGMEPMQMKRRKKGGGYNLRKSLAWDRAFFTDEGILDPRELTLITGIDASACRGGLSTISEEGNSSVSSDARCTDESCTTKENIEKTGCSMRNHGSLLHQKVTHKVLSSNRTNRGWSKVGGCSEPLAASSLKRPANSNTLKTAKKESKLPKLPIPKPGPSSYATTKGSMAASQLRHNLIPKHTTNVEKNFGLKSSLQNAHGSQSKAKTGSGMPVKELAQRTVKNLTHSSKAASSTRSQLVHRVQVDRANSRPEMVQDTLQACKVLEESVPLAAKHLTQHAAANSSNSLPEADRLTSLGSYHIQRDSKGLIISDRLHPCESQERPAALARPSGLRLPSPSLRLFDQGTVLESGSLQQRKIQQYMGSDRKTRELLPPARQPIKSNDITENISHAVRNSSKECCAPSTQLCPSSISMLNASIKGDPDSNIHQNLITKVVPRVDIKLEYECMGSEQEKRISGQEEIAAARKGDDGIKVSHSTDQVDGDVGTCRQLFSEGRDPETKYKSVIHNKEDGLQRYTAFSISKLGQSTQHQEEKISAGVDDLAQTSWEQADTEKSDDAPPKVNPVFHLDAGSQVFMKSQEQDEARKGHDVGTTKCVLQHGPENNVSKVVDDRSLHMEENHSPCSRAVSITFGDSHSREDVIELKGIDTFCIPFQNSNTEQSNDGLDAFPTATTTSPRVRDPSSEEGNNIHISPAPSIRGKAQLHDNAVRDTVTQLLDDNPSAEGFHIEQTTCIQKKYQLPITPLLHDNPLSTDGFHFMPTTSIKNKSQLQDSGVANRSPKYSEATTRCTSALLNPRLSVSCRMPEESSCLEEGTFPNVTDTNDRLSQEKGVSSAILIKAPGSKQDGVDVNLSPREVVSLIDDQYQSSDLSHLRPQVENISDTAYLGDCALVKGESVLQGIQCANTYPQSLEEERVDIAEQSVEAKLKTPKENHKSQKLGIIVAEKSQDSRGDILEAKPAVQGGTGGLKTYSLFQSENQTLEGSEPISNISKTNVEDGLAQLLNGDVLVQSCSRLTSEVHIPSIENPDHRDIHGKQVGFSNSGIKLERASKSNEYLQQVSVCKAISNGVEGGDIYECDSRPSVNAAPHVVEEAGNIDRQQCVGYRTPGSIVRKSSEHNESYSDGQSAECGDLTLTLDSELELDPSLEDKMFVKNSTCMEYCSTVKSCSFLSDSIPEEKTTLFLEDQELTKHSLLSSTEKILDSVTVSPERNTNASAQILPMVIVNGDDQPQGFVGIMSSLETSLETFKCDSRPSVNVAPHVEEAGNIDMQQCVGYRIPGSIVMESSEHNESYSDGQSTECGDLTLTLDSELELELEPSVEDKMFVKNSTCMECCSAVQSCSFLSDSMPEEKVTLFLEDQELTKDSLSSTEMILDNVIVSPKENTNTSAQILPMVIVNGDDQPQGFVGVMSSVETYGCDSRPSVNAAPHVEEAGDIDMQQCVGYITPGSIVMESSVHNESYSEGQSAECGNLTLTLDSELELEPSVEDMVFAKNSTCMEYCSAVKSCSFLSNSMPEEEKTTLFLEAQELTKDRLLSTEKILDSVIVSPDASGQILPMVMVNRGDQPQGFVGIMSSVETYESDSRPSVNAAPHVEEAGNIDTQQCVGYRTPGSIVMESSEHNESYSDGQSAECGDLTLTHDSKLELEPSVEDKMFVKNSTCVEYCSAVKSCSFLSDSMPEEKTTLFLEDQELTKDSLLSTEKILDSVIVSPEENTNASAQILPMVIVNGDDQPQGFVGKISIEEQVVATPVVGEFQHELDDCKDHKVVAELISKRSNGIKRQDESLAIHPPNAVPFSDEWLAAFEAAGEEILTMKCGAVQHSPQEKSLPEPSPWSPVKRKANQIGPYDCTKYTNANSQLLDK